MTPCRDPDPDRLSDRLRRPQDDLTVAQAAGMAPAEVSSRAQALKILWKETNQDFGIEIRKAKRCTLLR